MHPVSPYPNTALAVWQLVLIAVVAAAGIAAWLGAVFYAARDPKPTAHAAAAAASPAQPAASAPPVADPLPAGLLPPGPLPEAAPLPAAAGSGHRTAA